MQDDQQPSAEETGSETPTISRGPQGIELPAQEKVLREARALAGDRDMRVNQLSSVISADPVLTLEMLKVANALYYTSDRPPITNIRTAVVRLGSGAIIDTLDQMHLRPQLEPEAVASQFEVLRAVSVEVSFVAQTIAAVACRDLIEVAQTAGLMSYMGHMVACAYLGERYTEISHNRHIASLAYRLLQDYHFDTRAIQLNYLRMRGIPHDVLFALDRDTQCKTSAQANLRFSVQSAMEMVEAAHSGKWEKYNPAQPLPSKSALRLLKLSEHSYQEIHEIVEAYLKKIVAAAPVTETSPQPPPKSPPEATPVPDEPQAKPSNNSSHVNEVIHQQTNFITQSGSEMQDDAVQLSEDGKKVIGLIQEICTHCKTTQDLLSGVMNLLITDGPYARAALLLLGDERHSATVHTAIGDGFNRGSEIAVDDPLSPLALCLTKINSFNCQGLEDTLSPFGITSYAVSPIKVKTKAPVVLYADCGIDRSLPMEARKIFRLVVGLLNRILPGLPGGLPKSTGLTTPSL
jgi:HD-like signal output (HDOD) protein